MWPAAYWHLWSDYIIHRIHLRVLEHIREAVENKPQAWRPELPQAKEARAPTEAGSSGQVLLIGFKRNPSAPDARSGQVPFARAPG
jgi:hypothetical protein